MKRLFLTIIVAIAGIMMSCNPSKTSTNQSSNFPNSTTDTATTNHIPNPDTTQHR